MQVLGKNILSRLKRKPINLKNIFFYYKKCTECLDFIAKNYDFIAQHYMPSITLPFVKVIFFIKMLTNQKSPNRYKIDPGIALFKPSDFCAA